MPDFQIHTDPTLESVDRTLATYSALEDLRPFWELLGRSLAADTQRRWPLRRQSGRLRKSLTWTGNRLARGGIFQSKREKLIFGTRIFYADFAQRGSKHQRATPLIHVNEADIAARLNAWATERAVRAGLEAQL